MRVFIALGAAVAVTVTIAFAAIDAVVLLSGLFFCGCLLSFLTGISVGSSLFIAEIHSLRRFKRHRHQASRREKKKFLNCLVESITTISAIITS